MKKLKQTWRWYGPNDGVSLADVKQAGASGIVTALHHIPHGGVWPLEDILQRKNEIESQGLVWSVVESVPVHEDIKTKTGDYLKYLENYKQSIRNLAACGIKTICYNFMPVLDWTRTQLDYPMADGSKALYFNWIDLAAFDIFILKRTDAKNDYSSSIVTQADQRFSNFSEEEIKQLQNVVLQGIPGEKHTDLGDLLKSIKTYKSIGEKGLQQNLKFFLENIAETCEETGVVMTIHPDDPPFPILGLPRIANNINDFKRIISDVDQAFNGICFCTGSLGAGDASMIPAIFEAVKHRVYFAHLRNVKKDELGNFYEADHLDGDVDMLRIMRLLTEENQKRETPIPFRPDHGHQMLDDLKKTSNPGYSAIGRLRGLAELRGLEMGVLG